MVGDTCGKHDGNMSGERTEWMITSVKKVKVVMTIAAMVYYYKVMLNITFSANAKRSTNMRSSAVLNSSCPAQIP